MQPRGSHLLLEVVAVQLGPLHRPRHRGVADVVALVDRAERAAAENVVFGPTVRRRLQLLQRVASAEGRVGVGWSCREDRGDEKGRLGEDRGKRKGE